MSAVVFVCVSSTGVVVPTPEGGVKTLREGDRVEGDYYEQVAERTPALRRIEDLSEKELERLEIHRRRRTGASFPEDFRKVMEDGGRGYDPVLDRGTGNPLDNLARAVGEARGALKVNQQPAPADGGEAVSADGK